MEWQEKSMSIPLLSQARVSVADDRSAVKARGIEGNGIAGYLCIFLWNLAFRVLTVRMV